MRKTIVVLLAAVALVVGACGDDSEPKADAAKTDTTAAPVTVRLGYFPNITHATALVGVAKGIYEEHLGTDTLEAQTFNAGPAAIEALFANAIDATYVGPNPAINAWAQSNGSAIKIVAGATSGGAGLVVKPEITKAADLKGKKIASPQLGNTQDVALKHWLKGEGLTVDGATGTGDVTITPQDNGLTLQLFQTGEIAGAWVPEPWVTRLVQEGGGKVLVDEKTLWPGGDFVTTHLIVRAEFLKEHSGAVRGLLQGHVAATKFVQDNTADAQATANAEIERITTKKLAPGVIVNAWKSLRFTNDPIASSLKTGAKHAQAIGLLKPVDLAGIYDLKLLNAILDAAGEDLVKA
ncbi:MAG TPA: ABC transporter substrate-binding protein [Acidimicrobiales bacterium]|nr:ABC transporter substrate-binding protein [Acidimicrobiales bacterium]